MEGTFDSAKNQFKSNYVQYFLTQEPQYKTAYETAQKTMDSILEKAPPPTEPQEPLKPIKERSYKLLHQTSTSQTTLPSQSWKYWALGIVVPLSLVLKMF
jgi:hypothetical protein